MPDLIQISALSDNYIYLLHDEASGATLVVDPAEAEPVLLSLRQRGWTLTHILLTHHHNDHIGGVAELKAATGAKVVGAAKDHGRLPKLDQAVMDGDSVTVGGMTAQVLETPGHTVGHICYWFADQAILFCGDTLFSLGCGRLFEGTAQQMWNSLSRLAALPAAAKVCCAHEYTAANGRFAATIEPENQALRDRLSQVASLREQDLPTVPSTIGLELASNPFLRAADAQTFADIRRRKDTF